MTDRLKRIFKANQGILMQIQHNLKFIKNIIFQKQSIKQLFADIHRIAECNRLIFIFFIIMSIVLLCLTGHAKTFEKVPFYEGERLTYRAQWGFLPAGEAILEVLPSEIINGVAVYHFAMIMKTNSCIDLLYKVRERQDSYTNTNMTQSMLYTKRSEGKHQRDVVVNFDWETITATYSNFGEKMSPVPILSGTFDPLSLIYVIRLHKLEEGKVITIPVTDGKKSISVKAEVLKRETIVLTGKEYDTFIVENDLEAIGYVDKSGDGNSLKVWFTADEKRIPIRMQFRKDSGQFNFEIDTMND